MVVAESWKVVVNCNLCGKVLKRGSLRKHMVDRHSDNVQVSTCQYCHKPFRTANSLSNHLSLYHRELVQAAKKMRQPGAGTLTALSAVPCQSVGGAGVGGGAGGGGVGSGGLLAPAAGIMQAQQQQPQQPPSFMPLPMAPLEMSGPSAVPVSLLPGAGSSTGGLCAAAPLPQAQGRGQGPANQGAVPVLPPASSAPPPSSSNNSTVQQSWSNCSF